MKTTPLVLILFLTASGLWAQTPPTPLTPAQISQLQMRLQALTNGPAGAPAESPATPAVPTSAAPSAGIPAPEVPAAASAGANAMPSAGAVSPAGAAAPEEEVAGYSYDFSSVDVKQVLDVYANLVNRTLLMGAPPTANHRVAHAIAADQDRGKRGVAGGAGAQRHHGHQHRREVCESAAAGPGRGRAAGRWTAPMRPICRSSAPTSRTSPS